MIKQQLGSSTTGLLTASAIYAGLLVYTTQYAFNTDETVEGVQSNAQTAPQANSNAIVTPLAKGIFESETIASKVEPQTDSEKETSVVESVEEITNEEIVTALDSVKPQPAKQTLAVQPALEVKVQEQVPVEAYQQYTYAYHPDMDSFQFGQYRKGNADWQQAYKGSADYRGQGRGRGRGNANGDGEFDFSLNFKSRTRMDADTEWDGDFNSELSGYNNAYYNQGHYAHPVVYTYTQQY